MGLDIGAVTPEEIAVSVVAEMIAVRRRAESKWRELSMSIFCVVFTLVDHPSVEPETLARLVERPGVTLAIPRYRGRRGHPVYVSAALIPEFLALPEDAKASDVIHRHAGLIRYLDVEDAGVISDVDDAESYRRLVRGAGP
jgi:CTP:molybdopterin cytidylyltransferase MocA